ncbi:MAG: pilus assembly protein [Deltaproteobacteria bacterium]|jgi:Flp pilus assembly pilin Flp|nr:pilus assembly protein [Deltaproteobacteria bacterium]
MKPLIFRNQAGVAAVELAMVLPFMALLLFGTIDIACLIYNKQVLTNASRVGARMAIVRPEDTASAEKAMKDYCMGKLIYLIGDDYIINDDDTSIYFLDKKRIRQAEITIEYKHLLYGFLDDFFPETFSKNTTKLTGKSEMRVEKEI